MFSDYSRIQMEMNNKKLSRKQKIFRNKNTFLNNKW